MTVPKPSATSASSVTRESRGDTASRLPSSGRDPPRAAGGAAGRPRRSALGAEPLSGPAIAASRTAQSARLRAIGPAWSRLVASGTTPRSETSPRVGLIVETPQSADGMRSEPAVSVPVAAGTMRAASAAPEPPLEPPAERSSPHGLPTWSVVPPTANSCVCRCPSSTMPAAARRAQTSQSTAGVSARTRLDAVSGLPATP